MSKLQQQLDEISARTKVKIYKPEGNPDDRVSLCGSPVERDENGRQFFMIPAHQAAYQAELHPHYEVGEAVVEDAPKKVKKAE
jgi:hypothetical protein